MAANVLQNHNQNPYTTHTKHIVMFTADGHNLKLLMGMSPVALRVMIFLANRLNANGYACASLEEIAKELHSSKSYVNKGLLELDKWYFITKKKRSEYWLKPEVFRPIELRV
ncbi:helix-turn-helix domain-containing protein [Spirosoma sp.]|uniref:helix-turn-helix domain-containing protein n=1 Tax=Spirosoma sp. TaxID=1899569 RepID=UPI003B3A7515